LGIKWEGAEQVGNKGPVQLSACFKPAAFILLAQRPDVDCKFEDGVCAIDGPLCAKVDMISGEVLGDVLGVGKENNFKLRFDDELFVDELKRIRSTSNQYTNQTEAGQNYSFLSFIIEEILLALHACSDNKLIEEKSVADAQALRKILVKGLVRPIEQVLKKSKKRYEDVKGFYIPKDSGRTGDGLMTSLSLALFRVSEIFPWGSWPWTLLRETGFTITGGSVYTSLELGRIYKSENCGPVAFYFAAKLLNEVNPALSRMFARRGLEKLTSNEFQNEIISMIGGSDSLSECIGHVFASLRAVDDRNLEILENYISNNSQEADAEVDTGFLDVILYTVTSLKADKDKPWIEVVTELTGHLWKAGLKEELEEELKFLAGR
jgi:hypothetical protein